MEAGTKEECYTLSDTLFSFIFYYQFQVYMPIQEEMHWLVPFTVELLKSVTIPPIFVKLSIFKLA
jgi:hypothetical protein